MSLGLVHTVGEFVGQAGAEPLGIRFLTYPRTRKGVAVAYRLLLGNAKELAQRERPVVGRVGPVGELAQRLDVDTDTSSAQRHREGIVSVRDADVIAGSCVGAADIELQDTERLPHVRRGCIDEGALVGRECFAFRRESLQLSIVNISDEDDARDGARRYNRRYTHRTIIPGDDTRGERKMSVPYVVIVQGSPRDEGNCAELAQMARESCVAQGLQVQVVETHALMQEGHICDGCLCCLETAVCVAEDQVAHTLALLDGAAGLLWITPIYFGSVPGTLKCFVDRFQIFWVRRLKDGTPRFSVRRPATALVVGNGGDPFGSDAAITPLQSASNIAEFALSESHVFISALKSRSFSAGTNPLQQREALDAIDAFASAAVQWAQQYDEREL